MPIRERQKQLRSKVKERRALKQQRKAASADVRYIKLVKRIEILERRIKELEG